MNALKARKRYDDEQEMLKWENHRKQEEEKYAAMTEEEREIYRQEQSSRNKRIAQTLGMMSAFMNGPYSTQAAKDFIKVASDSLNNKGDI